MLTKIDMIDYLNAKLENKAESLEEAMDDWEIRMLKSILFIVEQWEGE